jgi:hypothetical protein
LEGDVTLRIVQVSPARQHEWRELWQACDTSTYFHSPEWARIWAFYSRGRIRPKPQIISFSDGVEALLPLCFEVKAGGLLSRYVSSTQGTYGGWLTPKPVSMAHALCLVDWLTQGQGRSLVWRLNPYDELAFQAGVSRGLRCKNDETHALRLTADVDQMLKGFKPSYRSQIKKAVSSGQFSVAPATTLDDWRAYFEVYRDSLQRWGEQPETGYDWRLFEIFFQLKSPDVKLWLARHDGQVVSGDLCLYAKKHVAYWHGATLKDYLRTSVAKLLKFEIIKDCAERGYDWFDFNPSAGLPGVKFFKEGFNAKPLPAPIVYVDTRLKQIVRTCAASAQLQYAQLSLQPLGDVLHLPPIQ